MIIKICNIASSNLSHNIDPSALEYFPTSHAKHVVELILGLKKPGTHSVHDEAPAAL
jgi:hypothetical protein